MMERRARLDLRRLADTDVDVDDGSFSRLPTDSAYPRSSYLACEAIMEPPHKNRSASRDNDDQSTTNTATETQRRGTLTLRQCGYPHSAATLLEPIYHTFPSTLTPL